MSSSKCRYQPGEIIWRRRKVRKQMPCCFSGSLWVHWRSTFLMLLHQWRARKSHASSSRKEEERCFWAFCSADCKTTFIICCLTFYKQTGSVAECLLGDWQVVGSTPSWVVPWTVKVVPIVSVLGTQCFRVGLRVRSAKDSQVQQHSWEQKCQIPAILTLVY